MTITGLSIFIFAKAGHGDPEFYRETRSGNQLNKWFSRSQLNYPATSGSFRSPRRLGNALRCLRPRGSLNPFTPRASEGTKPIVIQVGPS